MTAVYLRILQGPGQGQVLPVPSDGPVTLGRSPQASYAFEDPLLSRKHCAVERRGDMCRIVDLESRNGTFVNGQRVGAVLLRAGDRITIGGMLFEVSPAGAPAAPAASSGLAPAAERCQACQAPLGPGEDRLLDGRVLCLRCFDRLDVPQGLIEGFELLERTDVNSFGVTYLARQTLMDRTVVLRTISTQAVAEAEKKALRRFMREARTGGRLSHPGIVELYDVNEVDGLLYLVMEHVEGETLARHLSRAGGQPLPTGDASRVLYQVADALGYAHERNVVHRDVKPANVVVRAVDGRAKLQGFVVAKDLEGCSVITAEGESLGTPFYMSPEQVRSAKRVDGRSDIYSWGATAYHCLAGRLPLEARSYGEFIDRVFDEAYEPAPIPAVPPGLDALVRRCLARDPAGRPPSMAPVLVELESLLADL